jgi:hypothetical protein
VALCQRHDKSPLHYQLPMFERVKKENNENQQEFLPNLSAAIAYSTIKAKNNSDGLVEKIF